MVVPVQDTCAELQRTMAKLQKIAACNAEDAAFLFQVWQLQYTFVLSEELHEASQLGARHLCSNWL